MAKNVMVTATINPAGVVGAMLKGYPQDIKHAMRMSFVSALKDVSPNWSDKRIRAHIRRFGIFKKVKGFRFTIRREKEKK